MGIYDRWSNLIPADAPFYTVLAAVLQTIFINKSKCYETKSHMFKHGMKFD